MCWWTLSVFGFLFMAFFCYFSVGGATSFSLYSFHISWLNGAVSSKRTFNGITVPPVGTELAASKHMDPKAYDVMPHLPDQ